MVDPLVLLTAIVLGAVALISGLLAFRYPVAFRVAHRNIRRARARSILVILGLLVGTAIISGRLFVVDTVQSIYVKYFFFFYV